MVGYTLVQIFCLDAIDKFVQGLFILFPIEYFVQVVIWVVSDETPKKYKIRIHSSSLMIHMKTCTKYPVGSNALWEDNIPLDAIIVGSAQYFLLCEV